MIKKKNTLTGKILLGLFLGFIFGLFLKQMPSNYIKDTVILGGVLKVLGNGFTAAIKMMVVPLVFVSLICGTASMGDVKKLGRIGGKTMLFYLSTTAIAIITALFLGIVFKPGVGLDMSNMMSGEVTIGESKSLVDIILNIIPTNPIQSLANGEMLQVIFFALLTGVALNIVGKKAEPIKVIFESANEVCMKMVNLIMLFAPYGVFALVANTFATVGSEAIIALLKYILIVLLGMIIHITIVYGGLFKIFTKLSVKPFLSKFAQVAAVTFSTASSNASVPVSLEIMEELGVGKTTRSFTIPMGATINMDGTAIMQGVAALFIAQIYGIELGVNSMITIVLTATLASIGTAGVPGVGMIMLSMVLTSVGLPLEGIGLIMGVERIIDMFRTTVNVMGDNKVTLIIANSEKDLNLDDYIYFGISEDFSINIPNKHIYLEEGLCLGGYSMKNKVNIKEILTLAGTYISVCIGSGFATGQEIMQFFSAHGMISILSNTICMGIMAYCGASLLEIGNKKNLKSSNDIFEYLCGKHIGYLFKRFMPIFFFCSFVIMLSGAGASINQYYGISKNLGSLILAIITLCSVLLGINKVISILGNIGPIIAVISIGVGIVTISRNIDSFCMANEIIGTLNLTKAVDNWWMTAIIYSGLNLVIATPFLVGVGATATNKTNCIWGGILGGIVFMIAAMTLNMGIMSDIQNTYITEIPTLYMAKNIGPIVGIMFSFMLIAGIYTTAVPLLWSVCDSFSQEKTTKFTLIALFCTVIGFIGSMLPFSMLVNIIYPMSGLFGVIIIVSIFIRNIINSVQGVIKVFYASR